ERNRHSSGKQHKELSPQQLEAWLAEESCQLIDIREYNEAPVPDGALALRIPASVLHQHLDQISQHMPVVLICSSGVRTQYWVERLEEEYGFINISHLKGGWLHWQHYKQNTHE
ncbi:MAG TPA: rhodanese-like domain-containing protein, partial [Chitinophagaceae bacterium]|nr:rhodanese-like domain-containing protein [Chitinophagaceae bacterium]